MHQLSMQPNRPRKAADSRFPVARGSGPEGPVTDSPKLDLAEYLPYLVNRLGSAVAMQFAAEPLARHHLSIEMWRVMAVLTANGSLRQIDLADLTSIEASTLSRLVTRMVRVGLVTRTRSAENNREVTVKLSTKGNALVARLIPIAREFETAMMSGVSAEELATLKRCLRRMYDNVKTKR
jgi:MarR family transcriptional regulator, organic hydroperoxide resistance regulator